jgi:hypothetical protein
VQHVLGYYTFLMDEQWLPVPGYEQYEVSDHGRVRHGTRMLSLTPMDSGHLRVRITGDWQPLVHRVVLLAFRGPCPLGQEGLHDNDIPDDNRLTNLTWGTRSKNRHDAVRNGGDHNARKTRCPADHPYSGDNLLISKDGKRHCRACRRKRDRESKRLRYQPRLPQTGHAPMP